ncbi:MAG: hypothetical protein M1319_00030 [Chloroflexi bacterium]|nr:hypothetical protein [Chloroflexota bacterium]
MGRRDLHGAGAETRLHGVIGDDGQLAPDQRQNGVAAHQVLVALIPRVDGDSRVS